MFRVIGQNMFFKMGLFQSVIFLLFIITGILAAKFPDTFRFGAAGAAYQIEGAWDADGKGISVWDTFAHIPGKIKNNDTGDIACDSYHRYKEDVQILKELNLTLYRFSISWPRIMPDGTPNNINQAGIDHYVNLVNELKSNGIEPLVTLYHWDLPQHLQDLGGWLNPQIADYFGDFARVVYQNLGPNVKYWVTLNEPGGSCLGGYGMGTSAPGLDLIGDGIYQCIYNSIRAHAKAYRIYDEEFRAEQGGKVTINVPTAMHYPKNVSNPLDVMAVEREFEFTVGVVINAVFSENWPQVVIDRIGNRSKLEGYPFSRLPEFTQEEIDYIKGTHDYFSLNLYSSTIVEYVEDVEISSPSFWADIGVIISVDPSWPASVYTGFYSDPKGIRSMLNLLNDKYNPGEFVITENGWPDSGELDDQGRISYLTGYLGNISAAIVEDGVNVTGYTMWSFLDTFEWTSGYSYKFGLVHIDFDSPNRTRTLKSSAAWYKNLATTREIVN